MIEFYVTTTGNYDPNQIENPSSAMIIDAKNKTLSVMGAYEFDFQKVDASYFAIRDASCRGLSIAGANKMFYDILERAENQTGQMILPIDVSIKNLNETVSTLDASVKSMYSVVEPLKYVNTSVGILEDSVVSLESGLADAVVSIQTTDGSVYRMTGKIVDLERGLSIANTSINNISAVIDSSLGPINASINRLEASVGIINSSIRKINSSVSNLETHLSDTDASITSIRENYIRRAIMARPNGVATLDADGHVPASQLPSFVDDIVEGYRYRGVFYKEATHQTQIVPEKDKIYVDLSTETSWRWSGSAYVQVSESLALGETSTTAYAGDKGAATTHALSAHLADISTHVSETDRTIWEDAAEKSHVHDNKDIIDAISQDDIDNWDDASAKRHVHGNKEILDGIDDASLTAWKNVNPDWNATGGDASIKNRPNLGEAAYVNVYAGSITNTTESNNLVTGTQVAQYGRTKMTAEQVATIIDASIKALILDKYTTEDEVAEIVDSSIKDLHLENYASKQLMYETIDASIAELNVDQYMTADETADAINSSITDLHLENYASKTLMYSTIDASIKALNVEQYTTDAEVATIVSSSVNEWIPDASRTAYNIAASKAHTHGNSAILDGIRDASLALWSQDTSYNTGTVVELNAGISVVPEVWDASTLAAYMNQGAANSVRFCGDFNAETGEVSGETPQTLDQISERKGDMYVASQPGTYQGVEMQIGDSIIFRNDVAKNTPVQFSDLTFVQGVVRVIAKNPVLSWDSSVKVANVEGVDLYVKTMPMPTLADLGIEGIDTKVANISTRLDTLSLYAQDVSSRMATVSIELQGEINSLTEVVEDVSGKQMTFNVMIDDISVKQNIMSEIIDDISVKQTSIDSQIDDISIKSEQLSVMVDDISVKQMSIDSQIDDISTKSGQLIEMFDDLSTYVNTTTQTIDVSVEQLYTITKENEEIWASSWNLLYSINNDISIRFGQLMSMFNDLSTYVHNLAQNVDASVDEMQSMVEDLFTYVDTTTQTLDASVEEMQYMVEDLFNYVDTTSQTMDTSIGQLFSIAHEDEETWASAWNYLYALNPSLNK